MQYMEADDMSNEFDDDVDDYHMPSATESDVNLMH